MFEGLEKRVKKNNKGGEAISYWKDGVMVYKSCSKCGEIKEVGCFEKKTGKYRSECRECRREEKRQYYKKNIEKTRERNTKYYQEHKEYWVERNKKQTEERRSSPTYIEKKRKQEEERIEKARIKAEEKARIAEEKAKEKANKWIKTPLEIAIEKEKRRKAQREQYQLNKGKEKKKRDQKNEVERKRAISLMEKFDPLIKELNLNAYGYIYLFTNIKTGHHYVGQTKLPLDVRYQKEIIKAWIKDRKKFKSQKFKDELIEEDFKVTEMIAVGCCQYHLDKLEVYFIDKYDSFLNGYNNQDGNYRTNDGIEEFKRILEEHNLEFTGSELIKKEKEEG